MDTYRSPVLGLETSARTIEKGATRLPLVTDICSTNFFSLFRNTLAQKLATRPMTRATVYLSAEMYVEIILRCHHLLVTQSWSEEHQNHS